MIGVTIGIGSLYERSAAIAARCLRENTGLESVILTERHLFDTSFTHPTALKMIVFDLVRADDVLYYDADWFCINAWNPQQFASHRNLIACRDFISICDWPEQAYDPKSEGFEGSPGSPFITTSENRVRRDYITEIQQSCAVKLPPDEWINTGLFLVNRACHADFLKGALEIYCGPHGHHEKYYEQPAMLRAMHQLSVRADLLPRKYNVLASIWKTWPSDTIGLHVKLSKTTVFAPIVDMLEREKLTSRVLKETFLAQCDNL